VGWCEAIKTPWVGCLPRKGTYIYIWLYTPLVGPWPFFSFLILYTVGTTPLTGDQPVAGPLPTHRTTQTQEFEPTIPIFERAKTDHALGRTATVIGKGISGEKNFCMNNELS
jgi:hypothetical protein